MFSGPSRGNFQNQRGGGRGGNRSHHADNASDGDFGNHGGPVRNNWFNNRGKQNSPYFNNFRGNRFKHQHQHAPENELPASKQLRLLAEADTDKVKLSVHATDRLKTDSSYIRLTTDNPTINKACFVTLGSLDLNSSNTTRRADNTSQGFIDFFADKRVDNLTFVLPKANLNLPSFPSNVAVTCSMVGRKCSVCPGHFLDSPFLLLLGDQHLPPACGSQNDCAPVIRVQSGNFEQAKKILEFQLSLGLKFPQGSHIVVMMLSHLMRVGDSRYWEELKKFSQWCRKTLNVTAIPALPPYPCYPTAMICHIRQFYARLQAFHHADTTKPIDDSFSMWEVIASLCQELKVKPVSIPTPSTYIPEVNNGLAITYTADFLEGFDLKWESGCPAKVEKAFLRILVEKMSSMIEHNGGRALSLPSVPSINGAVEDFSAGLEAVAGRTVFIMGSSIMVKTESTIVNIARPHRIDVVPLVKSGDYKTHFFEQNRDEYLETLTHGTYDDICVISFLGNHLLKKKAFYPEEVDKDNRIWHLREPTLLTEEGFNLLMADVSHMLREVRGKFKGAIYLLGPFPRFFDNCCDTPSHQIKDDLHEPVDMVKYATAFTTCMSESLSLTSKTEIIPFTEIFGPAVSASLVRDKIHLSDPAKLRFAKFMVRLLLRKIDPITKLSTTTKMSFSAHLSSVDISISPTLIGFDEDDESDKQKKS